MSADFLTGTDHCALFEVPGTVLPLAAEYLAGHLGIPVAEAAAQLQSGRLDLSKIDAAAQLISMFKAFGIRLRKDEAEAVSVSVQSNQPEAVAVAVARALQLVEAEVLTQMQRPGGLILRDLPVAVAQVLRQRLCRIGRLTARISYTKSAYYDAFVTGQIEACNRRAISAYLGHCGLVPSKFSGALAANLSFSQAERLLARFSDCNLLVLDRAFQRFDLFLTGIGDLDARDVADFLCTRTALRGLMLESVTPLAPLRLETGLPRAAAQAFCADYAAIGLKTCVRLNGRNS